MPGRAAQALQGFAVDGRKVRKLQLSAYVRGKGVTMGQEQRQLPAVVVGFYDENRAAIGEAGLGPWHGTFDWQTISKVIDVPQKAREAVLRIGLFGAVGEVSFDEIEVKAAGK